MKRLMPFLLFCLAITLVLPSCSDDTEEVPVDFGYDYFPLELGKYVDYQVDSIIYDNQGNNIVIDTISLQVREIIVDTLFDNRNELTYKVERMEKFSEESPWVVKDVWVAKRTNNQAQRVEENLRFIKMAFPASVETTPWDGNAFIDPNTTISVAGESVVIFKNWLYEYAEVAAYKEVGDFAFESTVTVVQANEENLIELRNSYEVYAKGVGLVYKEMKILDTQCIQDCTGQTWEQKAQKGFIIRQTVIDHN